MKRFLFGILTIIGIGISFCSADSLYISDSFSTIGLTTDGVYFTGPFCYYQTQSNPYQLYDLSGTLLFEVKNAQASQYALKLVCVFKSVIAKKTTSNNTSFRYYQFLDGFFGGNSSCESSSINVLYNNQNSIDSIVCNGDNVIEIDGLSTITATNKFTPYFNIDYRDEDNQSLVESYSKDMLYLSGGKFKKTYTGNNNWILSVQGNDSENLFSGYLSTFEISGSVSPEYTGNVFTNFADNSLTVLLSNIPSYIQYVIIILLLFFILGFIRKIRKRR